MKKFGYALIACIVFLISSYQLIGSDLAFIFNDCNEQVIAKVIDDRCYVKPVSIFCCR